MRHLLILALLIGIGSRAHGKESWFCTDEASEVRGDSVKACGLGYGRNEGEARADAFYAARLEFWRLCHLSDTCKGFNVSVTPGRISCEESHEKVSAYDFGHRSWSCARLLTFTVDRENTHKLGPGDDYPENR